MVTRVMKKPKGLAPLEQQPRATDTPQALGAPARDWSTTPASTEAHPAIEAAPRLVPQRTETPQVAPL